MLGPRLSMRGFRLAVRPIAAPLLGAALSLLVGCTTAIRPVSCQGGAVPYRCVDEARDVKFC
jgi:hypothetical protein